MIDPRPQQADLFRRQPLALLRHQHVLIESRHKMNQRTLRTFAGNDIRRVIVAALQRHILHVQAIPTLLLFRPVTLEAVLFKKRTDVLRKIHRTRRWRWQLGNIHLRCAQTVGEEQERQKEQGAFHGWGQTGLYAKLFLYTTFRRANTLAENFSFPKSFAFPPLQPRTGRQARLHRGADLQA
nr:hypothetical protein [Chthoniobacter flavus]